MMSNFVLRGLQSGDLGWIVHRQGLLYFQEYGWDIGYEAMVASILAEFVHSFDSERDSAWVAEAGERVVGSIFLVHAAEEGCARLRLLYVDRAARGAGLGCKLVDTCVAQARKMGYRRLDLWTASILVDARRLYERAGFRLVDTAPWPAFGKDDLVTENWSLHL